MLFLLLVSKMLGDKMDIGKEQREIIIEPIQEPRWIPESLPAKEPVKEPAPA